MTHKAGVVAFFPFLAMAIAAIIHLHAVPGVSLVAQDVPPPDVNAVVAYPVYFVDRRILSGGEITVADRAFNVSHLDMGDVGEVDTVGLT